MKAIWKLNMFSESKQALNFTFSISHFTYSYVNWTCAKQNWNDETASSFLNPGKIKRVSKIYLKIGGTIY